MNFKPVNQPSNQNTIIKLQDTNESIVGNFVETTKSKLGSNIYHIRRDYDLIKVYGFKNLDEQMVHVSPEQVVRITYKGATTTAAGGIKHLALVEVTTDENDHVTDPQQNSNISSSNSKNSINIPYSIDYPDLQKPQSNILERFGIKR